MSKIGWTTKIFMFPIFCTKMLPWERHGFHKKYKKLDYPSRYITFVFRNKTTKLQTHDKVNTIPIVNNVSISKLMKSTYFILSHFLN